MRVTNSFRNRRGAASGFSLLEVMSVIAISLTVAVFAVISLVPVMNQQHVNNAYNTTIAALRLARDNAISQRTSYSVTFANGSVPIDYRCRPHQYQFPGQLAGCDLSAATRCHISGAIGADRGHRSRWLWQWNGGHRFWLSRSVANCRRTDCCLLLPRWLVPNSTGAGNCSGMNYWSGRIVYPGSRHRRAQPSGRHRLGWHRARPRMALVHQERRGVPMVSKLTVQKNSARFSRRTNAAQSGFSLIEVMISMVVLTTGLVSLLGVFGLAMAATQTSQQDMIAKQLADEQYESIVTARNTTQINWDRSTTLAPQTVPSAAPPLAAFFWSEPKHSTPRDRTDMYGTADDVTSGLRQTLVDPGPDGIFGTADDISIPLIGYQRTISITPLLDADGAVISSIRNVTITVQYSTPQTQQKSYVVNSYISQFN